MESRAICGCHCCEDTFFRCGAVLFGTCPFKYMAPREGDHSHKVKRLPHMSVMFVCLRSGISALTAVKYVTRWSTPKLSDRPDFQPYWSTSPL